MSDTVPTALTWGELRRFAEQHSLADDVELQVEIDVYGEMNVVAAEAEVKAVVGGLTVIVFSAGR